MDRFSYIDTHAHLNLSAFAGDSEAVARRCHDEGVAVIDIGTKLSTSKRAVELASLHEGMYAIVGLHPIQTTPGSHGEDEIGEGGQPFVSKGEIFDTEAFRELARSEGVVGIGECGFDYYHNSTDTYDVQEAAFIAQILLANELNLPLMIHTRGPKPGEVSPTGRSVYLDVHDLLKKYATVPGNVHFYAGTYEEAKQFFDIGFSISFTGVITFARQYEDIIKNAPLERMHAETDCPYVAPVPHRGTRAEPWMVKEVYQKIATVKGLSEEVVRQQLIVNATQLYRL